MASNFDIQRVLLLYRRGNLGATAKSLAAHLFQKPAERTSTTLARFSALYHELTGTTEIAKRREVVEERYHRLLSLRKQAEETKQRHTDADEVAAALEREVQADIAMFQKDSRRTAAEINKYYTERHRHLAESKEWQAAITADEDKTSVLRQLEQATVEYVDALHEKHEAETFWSTAYKVIQTFGTIIGLVSVLIITPLVTAYRIQTMMNATKDQTDTMHQAIETRAAEALEATAAVMKDSQALIALTRQADERLDRLERFEQQQASASSSQPSQPSQPFPFLGLPTAALLHPALASITIEPFVESQSANYALAAVVGASLAILLNKAIGN
eukprot:m.42406 g.42406  ORF g.42406 m.42406 type:complete len:331 (+) comp12877_c0_seq2:167-1159(+)